VKEIESYKDPEQQKNFEIKIKEYEILKFNSPFAKTILDCKEIMNFKNVNDEIDTHLLNEVYLGKVDYLITQDKKLIAKSRQLYIQNKVLSIEQFIELQISLQHILPTDKLFIDKVAIGTLDINDTFFSSLREAYNFTSNNEFDK
jgi:predicted nucleic acid-binding protein